MKNIYSMKRFQLEQAEIRRTQQINRKVRSIKQKYASENSQSYSRDKEVIGKIYQYNKKIFQNCQPKNYQNDSTYLSSRIEEDSLLKNQQQDNLKQNIDPNEIESFIRKGQSRGKAINQKISELMNINDKISMLICSLGEEELVGKYIDLGAEEKDNFFNQNTNQKIDKRQNIIAQSKKNKIKNTYQPHKEVRLQFSRANISYKQKRVNRSASQAQNRLAFQSFIDKDDKRLSLQHRQGQKKKNNQIVPLRNLRVCKSIKEFDYKDSLTASSNKLSQQKLNDEHGKLIKRFCKQIKYDQQLMKYKIKLSKIKLSFKEKQEIIQRLQYLLSNLQLQQLQESFYVDNAQKDPFFTERNKQSQQLQSKQQIIVGFIQRYYKSSKYWNQKLEKQFHQDRIDFSYLDFEKKGFITKQDLVRFISLSTRRMYTNRCIFTIYNRIYNHKRQQKFQEITIDDLKKVLCLNR